MAAPALAADAGASARDDNRRTRNSRCGRSPTSPATASGRRTVPGIAARHRNLRSCAVRLLLGRCQRRTGLRQRHARQLLDHDLAEIGSGGLKLGDTSSPATARRSDLDRAGAGEVRTEVFDVDLKMRNGRTMPARLYTSWRSARRRAGAPRTLVVSLARNERSDPQRNADVRFMRFFDHTPMAIAPSTRRRHRARQRPLRQAGARAEARRGEQRLDPRRGQRARPRRAGRRHRQGR